MFEKEIEFIYKYNLSKIKHLGSFITYEQLISTNIHPALLQYLSAEIDFLIYEDRQKLLKESLFDYSGDNIVDHFSSIGEEIKKTKKFSLEYLSKLLLHATSFNTSFIIRPKWSLMKFIFENENEPAKQVIEVKQILNYLYYYPYLKRLLVNFFNKKGLITISSVELKELLDKIDKINYESNFDKVIDSAFSSMLEFIYIGEIQNKKISKQFVELFLEDKGLIHFQNVFSDKFKSSNIDKYDISEFKNVILNYTSEESDKTSYIDEDEETSYENETNRSETNKNETIENSIEENNLTEENTNKTSIVNSDDIDDGNNERQQGKTNERIELSDIEENKKENKNELRDINIKDEDDSTEKKSFLESHIENLADEYDNGKEKMEERIGEGEEEYEPPEIDEEPRIDEKDIDEIYVLADEEEKIDSFVEEESSNLERVEIDNDDENPFDEIEEKVVEKLDTTTKEKIDLDTYIEQGTSITFKYDELLEKKDIEKKDIEKKDIETEDIETDKWPSKSSNGKDERNDVANLIKEDVEKKSVIEFIPEKIDSSALNKVISVVDNDEDLTELEENEISLEENETKNTENQQTLFNVDYLDKYLAKSDDTDIQEPEELISEVEIKAKTNFETEEQSINISQLLENKKITKIIEVVFDYDMEEFANAIDRISEAKTKIEAHSVIDEIAKKSFISSSVKELKVFKNIISEYFK